MARLHAEERRKQLLEAAREEFLRVGPGSARVSDIADRAGVNVALLYRYFDSKEQLFEEAIVEPLDQLMRTRLVSTPVPGVPDMIDAFYRALLGVFTDYLEVFHVVLFSDRANGQDFYLRRIAPYMDAIAAQTAAADTVWSQTLDPKLTTPMCVGMCWGVAMDAHFRGVEVDADTAVAALTAITIGGLSLAAEIDPSSRGTAG
ncbi:TetR family transcriptional regulator [Aeromicrobium sp. 636]|uniref:TetR/AcrR family transcriptional regulator n=1 Tax=Aeromicrobium senzhongii TaxID=2663859 RepID=A0A8I0EU20_9ACTN|nr:MULTISPECIES: TetR/AcrR family transcriptional regulator [Aeromicrobium]MBC9225529.1 TetR/AcrR family transcriptional regulator [Aeromicrobium senzhongii]MCQ3997639.1 TetR family transcriptional regulator [Aeromicrobium sp. 636]MTB87566.1 TetR family transcriptional regulator [Aeromicrobium senzhongii]QNL95393.1 TetR/AcrR family transcriptional regulator [Aeromicrobium senzhongii]